MNKVLIIVGPTATGKTSLGIKLAKKFNGELISADSRQVYQGMDIVTGKDQPKNTAIWGLDLVKPDQEFTVSHWLKFSNTIIKDIWQREKLPILVGGTGFWIKALIEGVDTIGIPPDWKLRQQLNNKTIEQLTEELRNLWPQRLANMNDSDRNNPRRLIRAIEVAFYSNKTNLTNKPNKTNYGSLIIGLKADYKTLYRKIDQRVEERIKNGAQKEVEKLIKKGYSWSLSSMTALGYQEWQSFFEKKTDINKVIERWKYSEHGYSRRQLTWFKKIPNISWFEITQKNYQQAVAKLIQSWYYGNNG